MDRNFAGFNGLFPQLPFSLLLFPKEALYVLTIHPGRSGSLLLVTSLVDEPRRGFS